MTLHKLGLIGVCLVLTTAAYADKRVALVIGNGAYQHLPRLQSSGRDASQIANSLKQDGFAVTLAIDLDTDSMFRAVKSFEGQVAGSSWAVTYYAGYSVDDVLIPVDATAEPPHNSFDGPTVDRLLVATDGARTVHVLIFDVCLPPTLRIERARRDMLRGFALRVPPQLAILAYSARPWIVRTECDEGSIAYATALAQHLSDPGLDVLKLFKLVSRDVEDVTQGSRLPYSWHGDLPSELLFFRPTVP